MELTRWTIHEVKERMDRGERLVLLDTRGATSWGQATTRLPGAIRMAADEVGQRLGEIPRGGPIITYCT